MPLPMLATHHTGLLTLNSNELPIYKDALPGIPGVDVQPLMLDTHRGVWVLRAVFHPGVTLPTHYHTGIVHMWTLSGKWLYAEYPDEPQTAGSYLFEPGSSVHTFTTPADNTGPTETLMLVEGSNVNFDREGHFVGLLDANSIALLIDHLVQTRGLEPARYIRPALPDYTAHAR
jgi:2,4'-dihydroxyacetophenone dioxygenase